MITNIKYAYHRNGVGGRGFYVCTFTETGQDSIGKGVAVLFPKEEDDRGLPTFELRGDVECAVFDRELLGQGNITFGQNSWRGDEYAAVLAHHIRDDTRRTDERRECERVARAQGWL